MAALIGGAGLASDSRILLLVTVGVSPALIGIVLVSWMEPPGGARRLLARTIHFGFKARYYAVALLMAPAASLIGQGIAVAAGVSGGHDWFISPDSALERPDLVLIVAITLTEIGWRGVGLTSAVRLLGSVTGAVTAGAAQGVWSLGVVALGANPTELGPVGIVAAAVAWSGIWALLTERTGGSLVGCILFATSVIFWAQVTPGDSAGQAITLAIYVVGGAAAYMLLPEPHTRRPRWGSTPSAGRSRSPV